MRGSNSPEPTAHALISRRCVNNCIFCTVARQRSDRKFPGKAEILRFIKGRAASGTRFLVFSGLGEPTLDPHFEEYLAEAGRLGFDRITLFTNGYGLTLAKARGWKKLGLTGVLVSLHGTEAGHDRVVQRKGSFREAVRALKIYVRLGLEVSVNTCLTRISLPDIPALRSFLAGYPLTKHTLAFPEWSGNAPLFAESLLNYEEVSEAAGELLPTPDRVTFFNNIPYCLVQKPTIESETAPHTVRLLAGGGERIIHQGQGKRFLPACSAQPCPL